MKVKELKKYLENMNDDGVIEISIPIEGEHAWWDCKVVDWGDDDKEHLLLKPTEIVMR